MATINVANSSQLMSALSSAKAGDTILLASGNYGDVDFKGINFSNYVTITSADGAQGAKFDSISIEGSSHLRLDGVHVDADAGRAGIWIAGSNHIDVVNSEVNGPVGEPYPIDELTFGIEVRDGSHHIQIENNYVHHAINGIAHFGTRDFEIIENTIDFVGADAFKFAGVDSGLIKNNTGPTHFYSQSDAHEDFMQFQGNPSSNLEIIGNVLLLQGPYDMQGIFFGGVGGHNNILIEENIIHTLMTNGIRMSDGVGSTITVQNNTLINALDGATKIIVPSGSTVDGNIYSSSSGGLSGTNVRIQHTDPNGAFHYSDLFVDAHTSKGITLQDLVPVEGSLAETYGAIDRLTELLDGTSSAPDASEPTPAPEASEPTPAPDASEPTPAPEASEPTPAPEASEPTPAPEATPGTVEEGTVYRLLGDYEIASANDVIEIAPGQGMELSDATLALTFNADTVSGSHGLLSKDASGYDGGGDHFTSYIKNGNLFVRFQDGSESKAFKASGIKANVDYDLQVSFGNGEVTAMLNGEVFGFAAFDTSWETNAEFLQIGANGWKSGSGEAGFTDVFDGTISDVIVTSGTISDAVVTNGAQSSEETQPPQSTEQALTPQPQPVVLPELAPEPGPVEEGPVFSLTGDHEISGAKDVLEFEHNQDLALSEGTIVLSFNADTVVSGFRGLLSKDASGYDGGGDHFTSYIKSGNLFVRFQDGSESKEFKASGIKANVDYDLQVAFGNGEVTAMLNGEVFGQAAFDTSWETNVEFLQVGANGWKSDTGDSGFRNVFDGTISDVAIFDEAIVTQEHDFFLG